MSFWHLRFPSTAWLDGWGDKNWHRPACLPAWLLFKQELGGNQMKEGGWTSSQVLSGKAQGRAHPPLWMSAYLLACWFGWLTKAPLPLSAQLAEPGETVSRPFSGTPPNQGQSGCVLVPFHKAPDPSGANGMQVPSSPLLKLYLHHFYTSHFPRSELYESLLTPLQT